MEKKNFTIQSDCDGLSLGMVMFIPEGEIKGIFQISHGMSEHKERYYEFMEYLTERGYVTIINDHRGHGVSVHSQEDLGYFYEKKAEYIVEDLHQITQYVKAQYPDQKMILFGHSMGSMVVRKYIKKYDSEIDKLIVCGSPSQNPMAGMGILLARALEAFKGEKHRSSFIQDVAFKAYSKNLETTSKNGWICSNSEVVEKYDSDPHCGFVFTLNGFQNLFQMMSDIYVKKGWILKKPTLPIFFIAGREDPVITNEKKWWESQKFLQEIGYQDVVGKLYEGLRHENLNEKNRLEIYDDIADFIKK